MDRIRDIGEDGLLDRIRHLLEADREDLVLGLGDDVAITEAEPQAHHTVWTIDSMVEGTHFRFWPEQTPQALAGKLVASNVSDLASKGATPSGALISLGIPGDASTRKVLEFYDGLREALQAWGCDLIGGDTIRAPLWCLTMALIGRLDPRAHIAARACVRPGHRLYVTGWPGESSAGLELLEKAGQDQKQRFASLIDRHLRPTPRLREGQALASSLKDLAMMDVSDGIAMDAARMARASGVRFLLKESQLPVSPDLEIYAKERDVPAAGYALSGGEDYELLFATDADQPVIAKLFKKAGIQTLFHRIGTATEGQGVEIESVTGELRPMQAVSFQHFDQ